MATLLTAVAGWRGSVEISIGLSVGQNEFMVFVRIHGSINGVDLDKYCRNLLKIDYVVLIMVLGSGTTVTGS